MLRSGNLENNTLNNDERRQILNLLSKHSRIISTLSYNSSILTSEYRELLAYKKLKYTTKCDEYNRRIETLQRRINERQKSIEKLKELISKARFEYFCKFGRFGHYSEFGNLGNSEYSGVSESFSNSEYSSNFNSFNGSNNSEYSNDFNSFNESDHNGNNGNNCNNGNNDEIPDETPNTDENYDIFGKADIFGKPANFNVNNNIDSKDNIDNHKTGKNGVRYRIKKAPKPKNSELDKLVFSLELEKQVLKTLNEDLMILKQEKLEYENIMKPSKDQQVVELYQKYTAMREEHKHHSEEYKKLKNRLSELIIEDEK